jgi:hypothetical protein
VIEAGVPGVSTQVARRSSRIALATALVVGVGFISNTFALSHAAAAATTFPVCKTTRIKVTTAPVKVNRKTGESSVRLNFTNVGRTCILLSDAPGVQTVAGTPRHPVGTGTTNDLMFDVVTLMKGQQSHSELFVMPVGASLAARCKSVATDGIIVYDGLPYNSPHYVPLVLHGVCSGPSVGNLWDTHWAKPSN